MCFFAFSFVVFWEWGGFFLLAFNNLTVHNMHIYKLRFQGFFYEKVFIYIVSLFQIEKVNKNK